VARLKFIITPVYAISIILIFLWFTACSSSGDDDAQIIADEFVTISGTINNVDNTPEPDVSVEGVYSNPGDPLNPVITTNSNAVSNFSIEVSRNTAVFFRAVKSTYAIVNTAKAPFSADITGVEVGIPTETEAQSVIDNAFETDPELLNHAWLVVDVVDATGNEVNGQSISSTFVPAGEVYTDCDGMDSGMTETTDAPCNTDRPGPMYIAYFDAPAEAIISVGVEQKTAPIRMGEITALEFEITALEFEVGSFPAGQLKYDADCGSCHAAGSHDTTITFKAGDLYDKGELLITNISIYSSVKSGVDDLTPQEILDLNAFLEDPSIMPEL
jgi:hypothetical protein